MATSTLRRRLTTTRQNDFTHCVIGAGVVGLAIARRLSLSHPGARTLLLERNSAIGTETSSRNSEVIHAGLYYPSSSLKTRLCIAGASLLYTHCAAQRIPHRRTGKLVVAQTPAQLHHLEALHAHAAALDVPTQLLTAPQAAALEPNVRIAAGALLSPNTGIVDSHALMHSLLSGFSGDLALRSPVTALEHIRDGGGGYRVHTPDAVVSTDVVVNAAGLGAVAISNMLLPLERHRTAHYCKGTYYVPTRAPLVQRLIYPAPVPGAGGLGTHLTLDMAGAVRFGPDVEWGVEADDLEARVGEGLEGARSAIEEYLPGVVGLRPDYAGMRPKLTERGGVGETDFWIREEEGFSGFVNLLGIESPGLTSSLAIAEHVNKLLYG